MSLSPKNPADLLEKIGIDNYEIDYKTKTIIIYSVTDLDKLIEYFAGGELQCQQTQTKII